MKKLLLTLAANVMLLPLAFGQRTATKTAADSTQKSQEKIVIVTEENAGNYFETKRAIKVNTLLKVNPLLLINGDVPVYVEQKLTNRMSAELSAGLTHKNYIGEVFDELLYDYYDVVRTNKIGYSFSGALHFFPDRGDDMLEGFYIGPEVRYRHYKYHATEKDGFELDVNQSKIVTDVKLSIGSIRYFDSNVFIEMYMGGGIRSRDFRNQIREEAVYNEETNEQEIKIKILDEKNFGPVLSAGFKLGYAF